MDKYLSKSGESENGLDFIVNGRQTAEYNFSKYDKDYISILSEFKQKMSHKILKFNPLNIADKSDQLINIMWFQYILGNKNPQEYIRILDAIGINTCQNESRE
tara:strand:- start:674 stop:982 length:309 start_codon:yes stop_codon:yes gene_type:complete